MLALEEATDKIFSINDTTNLLLNLELINRIEFNYVTKIGRYSKLMQSSILFDKIYEKILTGHSTYNEKFILFMGSHWIYKYIYKDYASNYIKMTIIYLKFIINLIAFG